jgi:hypothetical protein
VINACTGWSPAVSFVIIPKSARAARRISQDWSQTLSQDSALRVRCRTDHLSDCFTPFVCSGSDRAAERWREDYLLPGTEELNLHHLYRAMAFLGVSIASTGEPAGAVRCNKDLIEEALFKRGRDQFAEVDSAGVDSSVAFLKDEGPNQFQVVPRTGTIVKVLPCSTLPSQDREDIEPIHVAAYIEIHKGSAAYSFWELVT